MKTLIITAAAMLLVPLAAVAQIGTDQVRYQCSPWTSDNANPYYPDENVTFNSKQWNSTQYLRRAMLGDFLKKHPIIGMAKKEVKKRLGAPWRVGRDPLDEDYTDTGWYLLDGGFNATAQTSSFEVAYANGKVVAYREIAVW